MDSNKICNLYSCDLDVMNLLNEVVDQYGQATSFASGRPSEEFCNVDRWGEYAEQFLGYYSIKKNIPFQKAKRLLGQYGKTGGIINDLIAEMLVNDEDIRTSPEDVVVTSGAQEAMLLCLLSLCSESTDCILTTDPVYIGISGAAKIVNASVYTVRSDEDGPEISHMKSVVQELESTNRRVKAFYLVANYDSATGKSVSLNRRKEILEFCCRENIFIIEDNPYGLYSYSLVRIPNLKALDKLSKTVIYIGSFSKLIGPSLRIGFVVLPRGYGLAARFLQVKSFTTLNTSQYNQAVVGGYLVSHDCHLITSIQPAITYYKKNRDLLVENLTLNFHEYSNQMAWNIPSGGFFLHFKLPFVFSLQDMERCAKEFNVIVIPLSCFSNREEWKSCVRFSFSYVSSCQIEAGVRRFSEFVRGRLQLGIGNG